MRRIFPFVVITALLASGTASAREKTFWAVVAGVTEYKGSLISHPELKLGDAARKMKAALTKSAKSLGYKRIEIELLDGGANEPNEPTRDNFLSVVSKLARKATRDDDALVVYFTGHGADRYLYGSGSDTSPNTENSRIKLAELYRRVGYSNAGANFLFLDTCRVRTQIGSASGLSVTNFSSPHKNTAIFFSSNPPHPSHIDNDTSYGIFTKHLLNGLTSSAADGYLQNEKRASATDGITTDSELRDFLETRVVEEVKNISVLLGQEPSAYSNATLLVYRESLEPKPPNNSLPDPSPESGPDVEAVLNTHASLLDAHFNSRGKLNCGIFFQRPGFASFNADGQLAGFDVDICRGMSAAALGDASHVKFMPITGKTAFTSIMSGELDFLSRGTPWRSFEFGRDSDRQFLEYPVDAFYDGPGFMVHKDLGITETNKLDGASICLETDSRIELDVSDFFREKRLSFKPVPVMSLRESMSTFAAGGCDVAVADRTQLATFRSDFKVPSNAIILPETIFTRPYGPAVRVGDEGMFNLAKVTLYAMIKAEELGITSENILHRKEQVFNEISKLSGYYEKLGLGSEWAYEVISRVGNYQEVYDRNLGVGSKFQLPRGQSALLRDGGLIASHYLIN